MKLEQMLQARQLRKRGYAIPDIASRLGVSKGSVSRWVANIELSPHFLARLKKSSHSRAAIELRRRTRLRKEAEKRDVMMGEAAKTIRAISKRELHLIGIALYWGEGSKKKRGVVEFTNSDPQMISVMKRFFTEVCQVPGDKFRGHVYLHSHLDPVVAETYWSSVSKIPKEQFHKTSIQKNNRRLKKDTLPYGTFAIVICDTKLKLMIDGWTAGVCATLVET